MSIVLSLILASQSVFVYAQGGGVSNADNQPDMSFFGIPRLPKAEIERLCKFRFERHICEQYYKYGIEREMAWAAYKNAFDNEKGGYWSLSPSELYDKYKEVAKDIQYLWNINPEYKDYVRGWSIAIGIIIFDGFVLSMLEAYAVAPLFTKVGSRIVLRNVSLKQIFSQLISKLSLGSFWRNLGITLGLAVADTIFIGSAFHALQQTSAELDSLEEYRVTPEYAKTKGTFQDSVTVEYAIKSHDLLREIIGIELTEEEQKELEKNKNEIYNSKREFEQALKKALEEQGWGDSLTKRDSVITLYALEYIRAEMADMSDPLRYREASIDIAQIYFSGNVTDLHDDRLGLFNLLDEARRILHEERNEETQKVIDALDGSVLNMSGGKVGYYRAGHM